VRIFSFRAETQKKERKLFFLGREYVRGFLKL